MGTFHVEASRASNKRPTLTGIDYALSIPAFSESSAGPNSYMLSSRLTFCPVDTNSPKRQLRRESRVILVMVQFILKSCATSPHKDHEDWIE